MRIAVCIKQVPDTEKIRLDPETNTLLREGVESVVNPYDLHALAIANQLKDAVGGRITVFSMGPPSAESALKKALSCGADEAYLLSDRKFAGSDTLATSYILSKALTQLGPFDLILCGKQAVDGDTAQVGPGIAVHLGIPFVTSIARIETGESGRLLVERKMSAGYDLLEVELPALLSVDREVAEPVVPSLRGKMQAQGAAIEVLTARDIGCDMEKIGLYGSPTSVVHVFSPPRTKEVRFLEGDVGVQVEKLLDVFDSL